MKYRLLKPIDLADNPGKKYPMILSLHGAGGSGNDNVRNLRSWNVPMAQEELRRKHPCFIIKTDGTAKGDGSTDDTVSIRSALTAAKAAGKGVYFPNGTYLVASNISVPSNTSILGKRTGISLIKAVNTAVVLGALSGGRIDNLSIEDMFFLNVSFSFFIMIATNENQYRL